LLGRYNAERRQAEFHVGDLVLSRRNPLSSRSHQRSAKLDWKWSAPLKIAKFVSPVTILLANPDTGVIVCKAHVSQVKRALQGRSDVLQYLCLLIDLLNCIAFREGQAGSVAMKLAVMF
jgi:hypothetical protein